MILLKAKLVLEAAFSSSLAKKNCSEVFKFLVQKILNNFFKIFLFIFFLKTIGFVYA